LKSTDLGQTRKTIFSSGVGGKFYGVLTDVAADPKNGNTLYFGTECSVEEDCSGGARLVKSTDAGGTWKNITPANLAQQIAFWDVKIDPQNPSTVYLVGDELLSKSTDGGSSWTSLGAAPGYAVSIDPLNTRRLLSIGALDDTLLFSNDGGKTFALFNLNGLFDAPYYITDYFISTAIFSPWDEGKLFAATTGVKTYTQSK